MKTRFHPSIWITRLCGARASARFIFHSNEMLKMPGLLSLRTSKRRERRAPGPVSIRCAAVRRDCGISTGFKFTHCILAAMLVVAGTGCFHATQHSAYREIHASARDGDAAQVAGDLAQTPGDLNLPDDAGLTPLHLAASACHTNVVALLLDKGAKIDCPAKDGARPLHLAAQEGCADAVNLLLARGANVNARDNQNRTPLVRAEQWHQDAVVQLLQQHGGTE